MVIFDFICSLRKRIRRALIVHIISTLERLRSPVLIASNTGILCVEITEKSMGTTPATQEDKPATPVVAPRTAVIRWAAPVIVGAVVALLPAPQGLAVGAWHYFALFAAIVVALITEPIPVAAVGLIGVVIGAVAGLVYKSPAQATAWALSGFSNTTVWLVFAAYMFALGYSKTGLGKRIALLLIRAMGRRTLGLGYAIACADLALAPLMPSNTARSGGTIFPIVGNIPELYGSHPRDASSRKIGAYLMYTALAATCVTSSMFVTALAPNVLAVALAAKTIGVNISWMDWFKGFAPAGILLFLLVPILLYKIYPPEIKEAPEAPRWAAEQLRSMGPLSRKEVTLLLLVTAALVVWIGAAKYVDATVAAVLAVAAMVLLRVVSWDDVIGNKQAWDVLIYFGTLVAMAGGLVDTKFVDWLAKAIASTFSGLGVTAAILVVVGAFFFSHYLFASVTAHASALLPVFLTVAVQIPGVSRISLALLLSYTLGMIGILSPYATGPSPIYYGGGYIQRKDFWVFGLVLGVIFFGAEMLIVIPWLRFLHM
jgi:L-tartrate/succinate antiporter